MMKTSSEQSWRKLNEMESHNEIRKFEKKLLLKYLKVNIFSILLFIFRKKSFSPLESKWRNYCKTNKKPMEAVTVQWRGNPYNLWDPRSQLFWGRWAQWNVGEGSVCWSVPNVSRLCSKHKSHRWSNNSRTNRSYNEAVEERRSHKS